MRGGKFRFGGGFDSIAGPVPFGKNEELSGCLGAGGKAGKIKVGLGCPGPCRLLSPEVAPEPGPPVPLFVAPGNGKEGVFGAVPRFIGASRTTEDRIGRSKILEICSTCMRMRYAAAPFTTFG